MSMVMCSWDFSYEGEAIVEGDLEPVGTGVIGCLSLE